MPEKTLTERIPDPQEVRDQLAKSLEETRLLRQLLRVSEAAAKRGVAPQLREAQQRVTEGQQRQLDELARRQAEAEANRR